MKFVECHDGIMIFMESHSGIIIFIESNKLRRIRWTPIVLARVISSAEQGATRCPRGEMRVNLIKRMQTCIQSNVEPERKLMGVVVVVIWREGEAIRQKRRLRVRTVWPH
jgi:hypothetical protein